MSDDPVIVTGAGGFVCSAICEALIAGGRPVVALDRAFDAPTRARLEGAELLEGDLAENLARLAGRKPCAVLHGAAVTAPPEAFGITAAAHLARNTRPLLDALDWASRHSPRFVFLSSMGVFAAIDGPAPNGRFTESTRPGATCPYCVAKQAGERLTAGAAGAGFGTLSIRLGNIFGPHEAVRDTRRVLSLVSRMLAEAQARGTIAVATPDALRDWAWLPDLARVIAELSLGFDDRTPPLLHAGTPPSVTDLDLARAVAARVPGTTLQVGAPPHAAIRPPMGSEHSGPLADVAWTGVAAALDRLCPVGAAP